MMTRKRVPAVGQSARPCRAMTPRCPRRHSWERARLTKTERAGSLDGKGRTMRQLALQMGVSLDGMVARRGGYGAGGWGVPPEDPELKARKLAWIRDADVHLMGRTTYEEMAGFWPTS